MKTLNLMTVNNTNTKVTDLEYNNRCYADNAADVFRLQAFACLTLACMFCQAK